MKKTRSNYTLVCANKACQKIIALVGRPHKPRPVKYGLCNLCKPQLWNYRNAPITP